METVRLPFPSHSYLTPLNLQEAVANLDLSFVDMWLSLLRHCSWAKFDGGDDDERSEATKEGEALGDRSKLLFEGLEIGEPTPGCLNPRIVATFEDSRSIYLKVRILPLPAHIFKQPHGRPTTATAV